MRYAVYMHSNTKDLPINQTMIAYGNRQNAKAFARANNSDLLRPLKHLMETQRQSKNWLFNFYDKSYVSHGSNKDFISQSYKKFP